LNGGDGKTGNLLKIADGTIVMTTVRMANLSGIIGDQPTGRILTLPPVSDRAAVKYE